jgi:hypothetical protein
MMSFIPKYAKKVTIDEVQKLSKENIAQSRVLYTTDAFSKCQVRRMMKNHNPTNPNKTFSIPRIRIVHLFIFTLTFFESAQWQNIRAINESILPPYPLVGKSTVISHALVVLSRAFSLRDLLHLIPTNHSANRGQR